MGFLESEGKQQIRENHKQSVVVLRGKAFKGNYSGLVRMHAVVAFIGFRYLLNEFSKRKVQKGNLPRAQKLHFSSIYSASKFV